MRMPLLVAVALASLLVPLTLAVSARADVPPPDDQVKACVEAAVARRIVAKAPALGPSPCRVVGAFGGVTSSPGEAASKRDAEQKSAGYTWICPLTRSYREDTLYCKLPAGMTAEDALHGPDPGPASASTAAPSTAGAAGAGTDATKVRGCGGCDAGTGAPSPLGLAGLVGLLGLAAARRRR
jgi:MYXO-CTERM domain-containing protein